MYYLDDNLMMINRVTAIMPYLRDHECTKSCGWCERVGTAVRTDDGHSTAVHNQTVVLLGQKIQGGQIAGWEGA